MNTSYKVIIFDCVGPILIKKQEKFDSLISEINTLCGQAKDEKVFWEEVGKKYSLQESEIQEIISKIANHFEKNQQMWEFLGKAKGRYKIAMVNNGTRTIFEKWKKKFNFEKYFDVLINSSTLGFKKPDPRIYLRVCELLKVVPELCVFIDDDLVNVEGAKKVGMKGIFYDPKRHEEFLKEAGDFLLKLSCL